MSDSARVQFDAKVGLRARQKGAEGGVAGGDLDSGLGGGGSELPDSDGNDLQARYGQPNRGNLNQASIGQVA